MEQKAIEKALELVAEMQKSFKEAQGFPGVSGIPGIGLDDKTGDIKFKLGQIADVAFVPNGDGYKLSIDLSPDIMTAIRKSGIKLV